jgi:hypothetical protein
MPIGHYHGDLRVGFQIIGQSYPDRTSSSVRFPRATVRLVLWVVVFVLFISLTTGWQWGVLYERLDGTFEMASMKEWSESTAKRDIFSVIASGMP